MKKLAAVVVALAVFTFVGTNLCWAGGGSEKPKSASKQAPAATEQAPAAAEQPPAAPITLTVPAKAEAIANGPDSITVTWEAVPGAEGYEVSRAPQEAGPFNKVTDTASPTYTDTSLTEKTDYFYQIIAVAGLVKSDPAAVSARTFSDFFSGDGGKGMSLAVLAPQGKGLGKDLNYLPSLVQGVLVGDISKYSDIAVLDRQNLEKVLAETESGVYEKAEDYVQLGSIANVAYAMTGAITKTSSGYAMQLQVASTADGTTKASYSGNCTVAEFDDFTGIKKASADLLAQLGVTLTDKAKTELSGASSKESVNAQTALAQGIVAQKGGTVVEALSYYLTSANYDPSLAEAASRVNVLSQNISSGNIREDAKNDIQWRKDWIARLKECEDWFAKYMKSHPPCTITYSPEIHQGSIDYEKETIQLAINGTIKTDLEWYKVPGQVINTVADGLKATGRAGSWGLGEWPKKTVSKVSPFESRFDLEWPVQVELLNDKGKVIGKSAISVNTDILYEGRVYNPNRHDYDFVHLIQDYISNDFMVSFEEVKKERRALVSPDGSVSTHIKEEGNDGIVIKKVLLNRQRQDDRGYYDYYEEIHYKDSYGHKRKDPSALLWKGSLDTYIPGQDWQMGQAVFEQTTPALSFDAAFNSKVDDVTDKLSIRFASINGEPIKTAAKKYNISIVADEEL